MKYVVTICLLVLVSSVNAQTRIGNRSARLGFKLDPVFINTLRPAENGIEKDGSKMGISYGIMADFEFSDARGAFVTGIEVTHAAARLRYTDNNKGLKAPVDPGVAQNYDLRLQYIQVPASIKLKTNRHENIAWWGQFGTYLGVPLRARADYSIGSLQEDRVNVYRTINKVNAGLLLGIGGEYALDNRLDLLFGLGMESGFVDVTRNRQWKDDRVTLNRWALRFGIMF